jgi:hypothetical protein
MLRRSQPVSENISATASTESAGISEWRGESIPEMALIWNGVEPL